MKNSIRSRDENYRGVANSGWEVWVVCFDLKTRTSLQRGSTLTYFFFHGSCDKWSEIVCFDFVCHILQVSDILRESCLHLEIDKWI